MAKKSKRSAGREASQSSTKSASDPLIANRPTSFNPDYHYVIHDVRRVGILAGSFFIVLITLAIILHL